MKTNKQLIVRLKLLSRLALAEANKGNPFISKAEAMQTINQSRRLAR